MTYKPNRAPQQPLTTRTQNRLSLAIATLSLFLLLLAHVYASPAPHKHIYLLSKPINIEVRLGPVAKTLHHIQPNATSILKTAMLFSATGEPISALLLFSWETVQALPAIRIQSTLDLKFRAWWAGRKRLNEIKKIPGVDRALVLTSADFKNPGLVASHSASQSYVFVESSSPLELSPELNEEFGDPLEVHDIGSTLVRMHLKIGADQLAETWEVPLAQVFDHAVMPDDVAKPWSTAVKDLAKEQTWLNRFVTKSYEENVAIQAELVYPDGSEKSLGSVIQGSSVGKFLRENPLSKARNLWRTFWRNPELPKGQLPLAIFSCEAALTQP